VSGAGFNSPSSQHRKVYILTILKISMRVDCPKCMKSWNYGGQNKFFVTCPDCRKLVRIAGSLDLSPKKIKMKFLGEK